MIGRAAASLATFPRSWIMRIWGYPHIPTRQKWSALWPYLARLPRSPLRVLDAGCGAGNWSLELGARRSGWSITGVDCDDAALQAGERARVALGLGNVRFVHSDFLAFHPPEGFHVVLSVASAHYLVEQGRGVDLFRAFRTWLEPNGLLLLFAPRSAAEVPSVRYLPDPFQPRDILSAEMIRLLCRDADLDITLLAPVIGTLGTVAQQVTQATGSSRALSLFTYPVQLALSEADRLGGRSGLRKASSSWLLVARRPHQS